MDEELDKQRTGPNVEFPEISRSGLAARLSALSLLLAQIEADPGSFGAWQRETHAAKDHLILPWVEFSVGAKAFLAHLLEAGLVIPSFDWIAWDGRGRYMHDPASVAVADFEECRKLLTALMRGERFNEGLLLEAFESGLLRHLIDRLGALAGA